MTTKHTKSTSDAIKTLQEKDGTANNESARTNEILAARDGGEDAAKASLALNDPSLSRAAYTSHTSGFNEDLDHKDVDAPAVNNAGQTRAVNG